MRVLGVRREEDREASPFSPEPPIRGSFLCSLCFFYINLHNVCRVANFVLISSGFHTTLGFLLFTFSFPAPGTSRLPVLSGSLTIGQQPNTSSFAFPEISGHLAT